MASQSQNEPEDSERTDLRASRFIRILRYIRAFMLDVISECRDHAIKITAGLLIAAVTTVAISTRNEIKTWMFGFSDSATAIKYARLTHLGASAIIAKAYYDPEHEDQYIAAAYIEHYKAKAEAFKIVGDRVFEVGTPVTVYDNVRGLSKHPSSEEIDELMHYFGFITLRVGGRESQASRVLLFGVERNHISAGAEADVTLTTLDTKERFMVRDRVYGGIPLMRPRLSVNTVDGDIGQWLTLKMVEVLSTENWESIPLKQFQNGLLKPSQFKPYFPAEFTRSWFEQNGIDRVSGSITPIEIPIVRRAEIIDGNPCILNSDGVEWMALFKGPLMRYDSLTNKLNMMYVADPRNNSPTGGLIEGAEYIWFSVGITIKNRDYLIALRKSDNIFVKIPVEMKSPDSKDPPLEDDTDTEEGTETHQFPPEAPLKDSVFSAFGIFGGKFWADGLEVVFLKADPKSVDEASVVFKKEFAQPKNCETRPEPDDESEDVDDNETGGE